MVAALTLALAAAFLSHTSAFAIGAVAGCADRRAVLVARRTGAALAGGGRARGRAGRRRGRGRRSTTRTFSTPTAPSWRASAPRPRRRRRTPAAAVSGHGLAAVPRYLRLYFGVPGDPAGAGAPGGCGSASARDRVTLTAAGWAIACCALPGPRHPDAGRHAPLPRRDPGRRARGRDRRQHRMDGCDAPCSRRRCSG